MILINYKKKNPYKETIDKFTDENRLVSFGVIKTFISGRLKWLSSFMFKNRNNTQTNKHRAFIGWFGEVENILTEYGNVADINDKVFFDGRERPKFPRFYKELSSKQYGLIGQEYAEYDNIERVDISDKIEIPVGEVQNTVNVYHNVGDSPAFVAAGYKINPPAPDTYTASVSRNGIEVEADPVFAPVRYVKENPQLQHNIKFNNLEIVLGDQIDDILSNQLVKDQISKSGGVPMNNLGGIKPSLGTHETGIALSGYVTVLEYSADTLEAQIYINAPAGRNLSFVTGSIGIYFPELDPGLTTKYTLVSAVASDIIYIYSGDTALSSHVGDYLQFISDPIIGGI